MTWKIIFQSHNGSFEIYNTQWWLYIIKSFFNVLSIEVPQRCQPKLLEIPTSGQKIPKTGFLVENLNFTH